MSYMRPRIAWSACWAVVALLVPGLVVGADDVPLHQQIDSHIVAKTPEFEKIAAPLAADDEFLRRVSLDLTGTIPTREQALQFLEDTDPGKRQKLIEQLLASPEYARHMQQTFDVILMRRLPAKNVSAAEWQTFLQKSFAENKPWNQLVAEILSADGTDPKNRGPARFYLDRNGETNSITQDIARVFLGRNLECAQCHDHPEVDDYLQSHYYGISAFLVRSYNFKDPKLKKVVFAEKADGEVKFKSVFADSKKDSTTPPRVIDGQPIPDPAMKKEELYIVKPAKNVRPVPKYSRRGLIDEAIGSAENRRFARTAVNRFWAMFMGRGLVHPIDFDHSKNPPSHPELLDHLTDEFIAHKFDVRWLLGELTLSNTYQRSSRREPAAIAAAVEVPEAAFAQAIMKPLLPTQLAAAILQATGEADVQRKSLGKKLTEAALHQRLTGLSNIIVKLFADPAGELPRDFDSRVNQVLFLSNDPRSTGLVNQKAGNLVDRAAKLPTDNPAAIADELFLSAFSRRPTEEETKEVEQYLTGLTDKKRIEALQELTWAFITSAEFRFNH
ncbi:MAG: DUF1549 domain-containing protein [Planctomycetaceae bacterium]|nr:DUF1549 domain-containing protein [Planctomycetaceae bacterium]MBT6157585.1 DUF1549 domain-containing protein [Planctomycetaceae bacterium]MBT6486066.1 DUF1549 domain-containing protein [Planctomycetaceae bacterium]MBT6497848.1 DUF1549 domain-containing protein [Planctomycetaceae bacterium]